MSKPCSNNCVYHYVNCGGKRKCCDCKQFKDRCLLGRVFTNYISPYNLHSACGKFEDKDSIDNLIIKHKCLECGFEGEIKSENRKIQCPNCKTVNDFWLDGEIPPENHRNIN